MASGQSVWRVVAPTAVTAGVSTGLAVAVNYATGGDRSAWMWVAVAVLTVGVFAASLWAQRTESAPAAAPEPVAAVDFEKVEADEGMWFKGIHAPKTAVRAREVRSGGPISVEDIKTGRGDASHP
ncbi:hypothetical protein ACW9HR_03665 [Nocardia gipuzkoensis]